MQRLGPHRFVDAPELAERERLVEERGRERRVLELGAGPLDAVGDHARVVEREWRAVLDCRCRRSRGRRRSRNARRPRRNPRRLRSCAVNPTYATDTTRIRGIAVRRAVRAQLFEVAELGGVVRARDAHARLLLQLAPGRSRRAPRRVRRSRPGSAHWPRYGWPLRSTRSTARRPARTVSSTTSTVTATGGYCDRS